MSSDGWTGTANYSGEGIGRSHEKLDVARKLDDDCSAKEERKMASEGIGDVGLCQCGNRCRQFGVAKGHAESLEHKSEILEYHTKPPVHGMGDADVLEEVADVKAEVASFGCEDGGMEEVVGAYTNGEHALEALPFFFAFVVFLVLVGSGSPHSSREEEGHDEPMNSLEPVENFGKMLKVLAHLPGATFVVEDKWYDVPEHLETIGDVEGRIVELKRLEHKVLRSDHRPQRKP